MLSVTWPKAARNVQPVRLYHLIKHREHKNKIASLALKVNINRVLLIIATDIWEAPNGANG